LLTSEEIRQNRNRLGLNQEQLAGLLGIAPETLSRWETGVQRQQRSLDRFLRIVFGDNNVRNILACALDYPAQGIVTQRLECLNFRHPAVTIVFCGVYPSNGLFVLSEVQAEHQGNSRLRACARSWVLRIITYDNTTL